MLVPQNSRSVAVFTNKNQDKMDGSKRKVCSVLLLVTLGRNRWGKSPLVFLGLLAESRIFVKLWLE